MIKNKFPFENLGQAYTIRKLGTRTGNQVGKMQMENRLSL